MQNKIKGGKLFSSHMYNVPTYVGLHKIYKKWDQMMAIMAWSLKGEECVMLFAWARHFLHSGLQYTKKCKTSEVWVLVFFEGFRRS